MLEGGVTHIGVATDHVIESWRNDAWPGYKSSQGVPADLLGQFELFEEAMTAMGIVVWPMTDLEADDALASAAAIVEADPRADQILICTPDKDLGQCVRGQRVVCLDRRKGAIVDEDAVYLRFGVGPLSVPDWLALVGDSADGFPGVPGWGPKAATAVLARFGSIEQIPLDEPKGVTGGPRGAPVWQVGLPAGRTAALRTALVDNLDKALLFKHLATCVVRKELLPAGLAALDSLAWKGPAAGFDGVCERLSSANLRARTLRLAQKGPRLS
jgi:5'-3' exonuclease